MVRSENLTFKYSPSLELQFPDFTIEKNQHTLLLGDSGTGKTTLLHLLVGLSKPSNGKVYIGEQDVYQLTESQLDGFRAKNIGFIFQEAHLLKNLTITENIELAQHLAKKAIDREAILGILGKLQIADKAGSYPSQLSRGQLQRAAIARAVVNRPKLLVADEPTAALDDTNTRHVLDLLLETATSYGATLLIATHDKRIKDNFSNTYHL
ncbi:ATP-binding cassette domain-containing protein [Sphingobacterium olei]|uniref:ATP-binding cassette domain-containing protein n=1 Tax=Sphingobacterium olei TaxID=2571155 RepID=A0A4U0P2B9_9SPHI|nr:ATP-binding cassette domain-containing protein [Sphingobacterium olei]TJZ61437.1 ATP-binding cassette domain-containing protein [Sphingobacterium olei]